MGQRQQEQWEASRGGQTPSPNELTTSKLAKRPDVETGMARIVEIYERFVRLHPEKAEDLLEHCRRLTERHRPLGTERVLAAKEASLFSRLTRGRLRQLAIAGVIGEKDGDQWRFSEQELSWYVRKPKPKGGRK